MPKGATQGFEGLRVRLIRRHRQVHIFHGSSSLAAVPRAAVQTRWDASPSGPEASPNSSVKIIHRYVLREHVGPLVFAMTALTSLLLLNYIAKQIGNLLGKGLSAGIIGQVFALSVPFTVAMTTPMSVLVATLYAFSRLASENEITALKANGVSLARLLVPVLVSASVVSMGMIAFNDLVLPASNHQLRTLQGDIARKKPTFGLREQIINQVADQQVYLKAMRVSTDNRLTDVTIYDLSDVMRRRTIYADSGEVAFATNGNDLLLTLYNGSTLEVPRAEPTRLQRVRFDKNFVRVEGVANTLEMSSTDSYKSDREMTICELQNDVARYESEGAKSRAELRQAMLAVTTEALTGVPSRPPEISSLTILNVSPGAPTERSPHASIGRAYCDLKARARTLGKRAVAALRVPDLFAADVAPQGAAQGTTPVPSPPVQAPAQTPSQVPATVIPADSAAQVFPDTAMAALTARAYQSAPVIPATIAGTVENARTRLRDAKRFENQAAVELHKKFAISVACTVFVLVGAPIALRFPRGGVGLVIGVSLAIFGVYYVGLIAGEAVADRDVLTPFLAMWAANILLTIVGLVLLARMGRESATTRGGDFGEIVEIVRTWFRRERTVKAAPAVAR